jgi:hypothetical protein
MVLHNPNNWHWVNKDVSPWAREWLETELIGLEAEDNGATAKVDSIVSMDGDVDVSQRKGKVITLFDVRLKLEFSGKTFVADYGNTLLMAPQAKRKTAPMLQEQSLSPRWHTILRKMSTLYVSNTAAPALSDNTN